MYVVYSIARYMLQYSAQLHSQLRTTIAGHMYIVQSIAFQLAICTAQLDICMLYTAELDKCYCMQHSFIASYEQHCQIYVYCIEHSFLASYVQHVQIYVYCMFVVQYLAQYSAQLLAQYLAKFLAQCLDQFLV